MAIQAVMKAERPREGLKIDIHCHISIVEYTDPRHPRIVRISREELLSDLDAAGFDMAVILSDRRTPPEAVSQFISAAPDRLIGFGYVNPLRPEAPEEVMRQREELGLYGLKLYPTLDGYRADDPKAFRVYEMAQEMEMPVMFHHAGMPEPQALLRHTDPEQIDVVAACFPRLRIILAHLGYPRVDETLYLARKHGNIWLDISWIYGDIRHPSYRYFLWRDLLKALNLGVLDHIVFGTDYPGIKQAEYVEMLLSINQYAVNPELEIPIKELEAILGENAKPLLPT
ncbi:amidohydrolase family protein [Candidatus Bathyarchaeota archaeon]|nr:amidohydrolase family protein [Candidatus Bathyarchaeota archaeon]